MASKALPMLLKQLQMRSRSSPLRAVSGTALETTSGCPWPANMPSCMLLGQLQCSAYQAAPTGLMHTMTLGSSGQHSDACKLAWKAS